MTLPLFPAQTARPGRPAKRNASRRTPARTTRALQGALFSLAVSAALPLQVQAQNAPATVQTEQGYDIPAGPLDAALNRFARAAGVNISYDAALIEGAVTRGLSGSYSVSNGLAALLAGSGIGAIPQAGGGYVLRKVSTAGTDDAAVASLREITVTGTRETAWSPVNGYIARRSATATKTDTPILETPQSISVVTRDQIEIQGARRLEEALTYTPGVSIGTYGSNPEQDYIFLRGFHSPIFLDGTRQYRDYVVGAQMGVEPYGLERIDVLRGPSSVLYGQIAPGGVVNQVSKRPTDQTLREIQVTAGHPDRKQAAFDFSGRADEQGRVLYRLTGLGRAADGQMDYQGDDRLFLAPSLTWQPDDATRLTLFGQYQRDRDALRPIPLPADGTLYPSAHGKIPRNRFLGEPGFDAFERDQFSIGYEFEHQFNDTWSIAQNLRYSYVDQLENVSLMAYDYGSFTLDGRTVDRTGWHDVNKISMLGIDNQLHAKFNTGSLSHKALLGLDYSRSRSDWFFASATLDPIDAFNPVYGSPIGPFEPGISELKKARQIGVYVQDQIAWERWRLTLGGRYDWAQGDTIDRLYGGTSRQKDEDFTGRVGLTYVFDNGLAPYASYSTSFEPEIGLDGQGDPFKPTTAKQYEIGIKYQPKGQDSLITISAFDLTRQNILTRDPNPPANNPWAQIQTGEARVRGMEIEAKLNLERGLDIIGSYTYLDSEITQSNNDDLGKPLYFTPRHQFALWANYSLHSGPLAGLGLGAGVRYRGKAWGSSYEIEVPSHTVMDAALTYDFGKANARWQGLSLAINARNLLDKAYLSNCSYWEGCFYGEGRTVSATLKYKW